MSKYIRGNPEVVVQNMPGGGSLVATNYVHGVAINALLATVSQYLLCRSGCGRKESS